MEISTNIVGGGEGGGASYYYYYCYYYYYYNTITSIISISTSISVLISVINVFVRAR